MSNWSAAKWEAVQEYCPDKYRDVCYRCSQTYDVVDNIGMFGCAYHPGKYNEETGWSCCNRKKRKVRWRNLYGFGLDDPVQERHTGCTPCDHNDGEPVNLANNVALATYLTPNARKMEENGAVGDDFVVKRYATPK